MSLFTDFTNIVRQGEPLAMHTWFQLGGIAEYFAEPTDVDQVTALVRRCYEEGVPLHLLGRGSNILVRNEGVAGLVLRLIEPAFSEIHIRGETITAGAREAGSCRYLRRSCGLGRPGGPGCHPRNPRRGAARKRRRSRRRHRAVDRLGNCGHPQWRHRGCRREDLVFSYRESNLDEPVILTAALDLERDDPRELARRMQKQWIVRKASQPMGHQCAGCVFKNPRGVSAGELIEKAGLRGTRIGGAVVSDRHANFVVAEPEATSNDVLRLIDLVRSQVHDRLGMELELELEIW